MSEDADGGRRSKRQKIDKKGRFAALAKLKGLKGSKYKYEVDEVENVYDVVDEREYTKKVLGRQEADWIVDDDGSGYVEDGREIFDDDLDTESITRAAASERGKGAKRKKKAVSENAGKGNLHFMLSAMPAKKKEDVRVADDDVLSELINEIDAPETSKKPSISASSSFSLLEEKRAVQNYMRSFVKAKKPTPVTPTTTTTTEPSTSTTYKAEETIFEETTLEETVGEMSQDTTIVEEPTVKSGGLLFKIEAPPPQPEPEIPEVNHMDFDDDFDFSQVDNAIDNVEVKQEEHVTEGWTYTKEATAETEELIEAPELSQDDGKEEFLFYWWDAYEDPKNRPGVVLLFGKTFDKEQNNYVSCSVVVKNVMRKAFLLPRPFKLDRDYLKTQEPVSIKDVYEEFNDYMRGLKLMHKSRKVTKMNAFDASAPDESEYLEVRYNENIAFEEEKFRTIEKVYGTKSSFLEIFLLDRKIKGPCWLKVANAEKSANPVTHVVIEMTCEKPTGVSVLESAKPLPPPPLTVLAINIKPAQVQRQSNEIAMISCLVQRRYHVDKDAPNPPFQEHFAVITKLSSGPMPADMHHAVAKYKATRVQKMDSERALLNYFLGQFARIDPDLIVGVDLAGYQLSVLVDRLDKIQPSNYSRLSRIRRPNGAVPKAFLERRLFVGRLVCDVKVSAKELIRSRSYDLDALCEAVLKVPAAQRIEIEPENVPAMYENVNDLFKMISFTMQDASYVLRMMYELNVIPLALQITNIAGNLMSRTLMGGRSERNEFLLLHAFNEKDYIVPEKSVGTKGESGGPRKKAAYSGGLVLDPQVGFYDKYVLLMDFNSLYPSIIQEYNICFTTVKILGEDVVLPDKSVPPGILPTEIRKLVESRREVKKLMGNETSPELRKQYHIRQMALKLTANSMYGCLGFAQSRFYAKSLAALVTQKGRTILTNTKEVVQRLGYNVLYGDTDSIMIETNILDYNEVFKIGRGIKQEINKLYKQVELDIDGVFKYLLLLKKKKYAAVSITKGKDGKLVETEEFKGLDIVRRDWSGIAVEAGKFILSQILSEQTADERVENVHNYLAKLKSDFDGNAVPLQLLVIVKQLTKEPQQYAEKNSLAHVQVALRNNRTKGKKFKAGDTVPYVVCTDGTSNSATQRAYLVEELNSNPDLAVDKDYYLSQQILPVVTRICEPIEGTDAHQLASHLGIELATVKHHTPTSTRVNFENFKKLENQFRNVKPLVIPCKSCRGEIKFERGEIALEKCPHCAVPPYNDVDYLKKKLTLEMRRYVQKYYASEYTCEDPLCVKSTRCLPQKSAGIYSVCHVCNAGVLCKIYTEHDLYAQLKYFEHLFDLVKIDEKTTNPKLELTYARLKEHVENTLKRSAYSHVSVGEIFAIFNVAKKKGKSSAELFRNDTVSEEKGG